MPACWNKWPRWGEFWFYIHVCTDDEVAQALENGLPKASVLVSKMTLTEGVRLADCFEGGAANVQATQSFALTSRHQISHGLVEEWVILDRWPLSSETHFAPIIDKGGYKGLVLDVRRPDDFDCDFNYACFMELLANHIVGPYSAKEHRANYHSLARQRCLNRVLDAMGVCYSNRLDPSPGTSAGAEAPAAEAPAGRRG